MALIDCPSCHKKISSKAEQCEHCGFSRGNMDEEQLKRKRQLDKVNLQQKIMTQSIVAMLLFVGGFAYTFWNGEVKSDWSLAVGYGASGLGLVWYLVNRVRLVLLKRKAN